MAQPRHIEPTAYASFPFDDSIISWLKRNSCANNCERNQLQHFFAHNDTNLHQASIHENSRAQRVKNAADY